MQNDPLARRLRARFQELREQELQRTPDFQRLLSGGQEAGSLRGVEAARIRPNVARPRWRRLAWAGGLLAAAATTALIFRDLPSASEARFEAVVKAFSADPASGAWRSPTDGLLRLPGPAILSTRPTLGDPQLGENLGSAAGTHQL